MPDLIRVGTIPYPETIHVERGEIVKKNIEILNKRGHCKYAFVKKYGTSVYCQIHDDTLKGISSKACEKFEERPDREKERAT